MFGLGKKGHAAVDSEGGCKGRKGKKVFAQQGQKRKKGPIAGDKVERGFLLLLIDHGEKGRKREIGKKNMA